MITLPSTIWLHDEAVLSKLFISLGTGHLLGRAKMAQKHQKSFFLRFYLLLRLCETKNRSEVI